MIAGGLIVAIFSGFPSSGSAQARPDIAARNAIVVDAGTGDVLYARAMNEHVPPASLTKLFSGIVALESLSSDTLLTVSDSDLVGEASMGLHGGEELPFGALLYGMMLVSGNDAALTVARSAGYLAGDSPRQSVQRFIDRANARIAALGITDTHLANPHGLDQDDHYSSARDLAAIALYALRNQPELIDAMGAPEYRGYGHSLHQTNELLGRYPGLIAGKTGFTQHAGNCLIEIAQRDGRTVVVVLLGSTDAAWYQDAATLLDFGFSMPSRIDSALGQIEFSPDSSLEPTGSIGSTMPDVLDVADDTVVVRASDPNEHDRRAPWRWLGILTLAAPLGVLGMFSVQRSQRPRRRRSAMRPPLGNRLTTVHDHSTVSGWETQPLPVVAVTTSWATAPHHQLWPRTAHDIVSLRRRPAGSNSSPATPRHRVVGAIGGD